MSFASFRHPESIGEVNEFQSVLHTTPGGPTIAAHSHDGGLTGQQLYDRIETQLELLDKKRLQLQQLLRSWHQTPYSSRLARNVEASRVESAKLAKKVHHLFKFIPTIEAEAKASATSSSFSSSTELDPSIQLKFQPLFQNYAAVSRILNLVCLESIQFEKEIEEKGLNKTNGSTSGSTPTRRRLSSTSDSPSSTVPNSVRRKQLNAEPVPNDFRLDSDSPTLHLQQQVLDDSLPALEVNGLDAYEASKKRGEFMNLQSMVLDVATSFQTLNQLSAQQQQFVDMSESNINATQLKTLKAENELRQASRYKAYGLVLAGGVTGAAIAGPIGALVGLKTGLSVGVGIGLLGAGGALLGAAAGKQIQKARFVPVTHEEEEQEMQLLEKDKNQPAATTASSSTSSSSSSSVTTSPDKGRACSRKCM